MAKALAQILANILTPENVLSFAASLIGIALRQATEDIGQRIAILNTAETLLAETWELVKKIREEAGLTVHDFPQAKK